MSIVITLVCVCEGVELTDSNKNDPQKHGQPMRETMFHMSMSTKTR